MGGKWRDKWHKIWLILLFPAHDGSKGWFRCIDWRSIFRSCTTFFYWFIILNIKVQISIPKSSPTPIEFIQFASFYCKLNEEKTLKFKFSCRLCLYRDGVFFTISNTSGWGADKNSVRQCRSKSDVFFQAKRFAASPSAVSWQTSK